MKTLLIIILFFGLSLDSLTQYDYRDSFKFVKVFDGKKLAKKIEFKYYDNLIHRLTSDYDKDKKYLTVYKFSTDTIFEVNYENNDYTDSLTTIYSNNILRNSMLKFYRKNPFDNSLERIFICENYDEAGKLVKDYHNDTSFGDTVTTVYNYDPISNRRLEYIESGDYDNETYHGKYEYELEGEKISVIKFYRKIYSTPLYSDENFLIPKFDLIWVDSFFYNGSNLIRHAKYKEQVLSSEIRYKSYFDDGIVEEFDEISNSSTINVKYVNYKVDKHFIKDVIRTINNNNLRMVQKNSSWYDDKNLLTKEMTFVDDSLVNLTLFKYDKKNRIIKQSTLDYLVRQKKPALIQKIVYRYL